MLVTRNTSTKPMKDKTMANLVVREDEHGNWTRSETPNNKDGMYFGVSWDTLIQFLRDREVAKLGDNETIEQFDIDPNYGIQCRVAKRCACK